MHERTMRAVARGLFVLCCAVPTCITFLVILVLWSPWYHRRCVAATENTLALQTGLDVRIGGLQRINPTTWQLRDVQLRDNETRQSVGRVRIVTWVQEKDQTSLVLSQPEIQAEFLDDLWRLVHERFLCRPEHMAHPIRVSANDLTIDSAQTRITVRDLDGGITPNDKEITATFELVLAGERPDVEPISIEVKRHRDADLPHTSVSLLTGQLNAPIAWLSGYHKSLARLGDEATFHGAARFTQVRDETGLKWMVDLSGARFENLNLSRLTESLPHQLFGTGSLQLNRCRVSPGEVVDVDGILRISQGFMSASLLPRLVEDLGCRLTMPMQEDFQFDLIAVDFDLYDGRLSIEGLCNTQRGFEKMPPGTMVTAGGQELVLTGPNAVAATQLASVFAPPHSVAVPVSVQTIGILSVLQPPRGPLTIQDAIGPMPSVLPLGVSNEPNEVISARIRGVTPAPPAIRR